jgi:type IV secretion system protein VirB3/type IV secretion system protein VirB4
MRTYPIFQSLHRHNHVMGAEREPALLTVLFAFLVGTGGFTLVSGLVAIVFYVATIFVLRKMAKADPIMTKVWARHMKLQLIYPSKSGIWRQK